MKPIARIYNEKRAEAADEMLAFIFKSQIVFFYGWCDIKH